MKGITRSEHEKRIEILRKKTFKIKDTLLSDMVSMEIDHLSTFYDDYQWHIRELRKLVEKYNAKTEDLKDLLKRKNTVKNSDG